jgi:integrase
VEGRREFGWAKTYGANYVALARLLDCRLVTLDARLRRGTARLDMQECLGHAQIQTTMRYVHFRPPNEAARELFAAFAEAT